MTYPIMPPSDLETVAHLDELLRLKCATSHEDCFTSGQWYDIHTGEFLFKECITRYKPDAHKCEVSGKDTAILVQDNLGRTHRFLDKPESGGRYKHGEELLWRIFDKPELKTVAEQYPQRYERNKEMLLAFETMAGFYYMGQQLDYLARVAVNDSGVVAGQTGSGKTLFAISLIQIKGPKRALILAPQGTVQGSKKSESSQWISELKRFAVGWPVFELFSLKDLNRIKESNSGILPFGIYFSWYQSFLSNGKTTLASLLKEDFEFIALDEGHVISKLSSQTCKDVLKLNAKYRWVLTATPATNTIADMFPLIGWTAVPCWVMGNKKTESWPFTCDDLPNFEDKFLCRERDMTKESVGKSRCEVSSPVISSPSRLIKLVSPHVAFISKKMVNPNYREATVLDVRVPLGTQQAALYRYFMDRNHITCINPLERARRQSVYLRNICADPEGFSHGGPKVATNLNPKTMAVLKLAQQPVSRGDPVIIISARIGQSTSIHELLKEAGVSVSRIDSSVPSKQHSYHSNLFKTGQSQVHIMGLKSAVSHGYNECPNEIIASIEWAPGALDQAKGRFDRAVSKYDRTLWIVLNSHTIEEVQWDICSSKEDGISLILQGKRVPRNYHPMSIEEALSMSLAEFKADSSIDETECAKQWPALKAMFLK